MSLKIVKNPPSRSRILAATGKVRQAAGIAIVIAMLSPVSMVRAFEPGSERICTPSADGQTFECREKASSSTGETSAPAASRPEQPASEPEVATQPERATVSSAAADSAPPPASKLPNYLLQSPRASRPISATSPAPAPVADSSATAPTEVRTTGQEPDEPAKTESPALSAEPQATRSLHAEPLESPELQPAPAAESAPAAAIEASAESTASAPAALPTAAVKEAGTEIAPEPMATAELAQPRAPVRAARPSLPGASAFLALPATHYTLVLASVRDPSALDALVESLDALPGPLFLIKLGMPDGDWYSLCWSDFADMDSARAARASLPGDAAITSGWPRRIGPLQKEIAR
jgi:hypothetical protein